MKGLCIKANYKYGNEVNILYCLGKTEHSWKLCCCKYCMALGNWIVYVWRNNLWFWLVDPYIYQWCTNCGFHVSLVIKYSVVVPNILASWYLPSFMLPLWCLKFWDGF